MIAHVNLQMIAADNAEALPLVTVVMVEPMVVAMTAAVKKVVYTIGVHTEQKTVMLHLICMALPALNLKLTTVGIAQDVTVLMEELMVITQILI
jgi:hypothetical protein